MDLRSKIILISGPTASGKSNFAIKFAKKIDGEIINADSMQVYKQLKILSARPDPKQYQKIKSKGGYYKACYRLVWALFKRETKTCMDANQCLCL